jgi:hypothetical protein
MPTMGSYRKIMRCAAIALLLSAAVDLIAVDLSNPSFCESTHSAGVLTQDGTGIQFDITISPEHRDDCFCCCSHIVISHTVDFSPATSTAFIYNWIDASGPTTEPFRIERPPRV